MRKISEKKQAQIDAFLATPISVGEDVSIRKLSKSNYYTILSIVGEDVKVVYNKQEYDVKLSDIDGRFSTYTTGADPFFRKYENVRSTAFTLSSLIHNFNLDNSRTNSLDVIEGIPLGGINWNPYVYLNDGSKFYYQRDFVWTLEDNQLLVESIYMGIGCGTILVRDRSWDFVKNMANSGETPSFKDIVDGKQRLNAIRGFINDEFTDFHGNYYSDLSHQAQHDFVNHQLFNYAELNDKACDEEVLYQFLKTNHSGKPQSPEHINHVREMISKVSV